jgi:hypothetical protein
VWRRSPTINEKTEIDQRLFSLLRGLTDDSSKPVQAAPQPPPLGASPAALARYRREQAKAAMQLAQSSMGMGANGEAPPKALTDFYDGLKKIAVDEPTGGHGRPTGRGALREWPVCWGAIGLPLLSTRTTCHG